MENINKCSNKNLTKNAQVLRKTMTKEEKHLWYDFLKKLPITVYRQRVIGNYIVDFYCPHNNLVIELDGGQHFEEQGKQADIERDRFLCSLGLTVVRYTNLEIHKKFNAVCDDIWRRLGL